MLFPSVGGYMLKTPKLYFVRLVPTYIRPAKEVRLLGKFQPDSFKSERLVCVETGG